MFRRRRVDCVIRMGLAYPQGSSAPTILQTTAIWGFPFAYPVTGSHLLGSQGNPHGEMLKVGGTGDAM